MKTFYLVVGVILPIAVLAGDGLGTFEKIPTQSSLPEITKLFSLAAANPLLNEKGKIQDGDQVADAEPCNEENIASETNTDDDNFTTAWCRVILTAEQQKIYKKVDFKFVKMKEQFVLEAIEIEYKIPRKEFLSSLTKLYQKSPITGDSLTVKTQIRGGVPSGNVTVWKSQDSDKRSHEQSLIVYNNSIASQVHELTKLEKEDEFVCPKGMIADSQAKLIPYKAGEEESSFSGFIAYCVAPKGARTIATYEQKIGFDKNGYLRKTKELAFKNTVYDAKHLNGPYWVWHLDSRKLIEKRTYKNGEIVSRETVGDLPQD